jgi:hypothetical protein
MRENPVREFLVNHVLPEKGLAKHDFIEKNRAYHGDEGQIGP